MANPTLTAYADTLIPEMGEDVFNTAFKNMVINWLAQGVQRISAAAPWYWRRGSESLSVGASNQIYSLTASLTGAPIAITKATAPGELEYVPYERMIRDKRDFVTKSEPKTWSPYDYDASTDSYRIIINPWPDASYSYSVLRENKIKELTSGDTLPFPADFHTALRLFALYRLALFDENEILIKYFIQDFVAYLQDLIPTYSMDKAVRIRVPQIELTAPGTEVIG